MPFDSEKRSGISRGTRSRPSSRWGGRDGARPEGGFGLRRRSPPSTRMVALPKRRAGERDRDREWVRPRTAPADGPFGRPRFGPPPGRGPVPGPMRGRGSEDWRSRAPHSRGRGSVGIRSRGGRGGDRMGARFGRGGFQRSFDRPFSYRSHGPRGSGFPMRRGRGRGRGQMRGRGRGMDYSRRGGWASGRRRTTKSTDTFMTRPKTLGTFGEFAHSDLLNGSELGALEEGDSKDDDRRLAESEELDRVEIARRKMRETVKRLNKALKRKEFFHKYLKSVNEKRAITLRTVIEEGEESHCAAVLKPENEKLQRELEESKTPADFMEECTKREPPPFGIKSPEPFSSSEFSRSIGLDIAPKESSPSSELSSETEPELDVEEIGNRSLNAVLRSLGTSQLKKDLKVRESELEETVRKNAAAAKRNTQLEHELLSLTQRVTALGDEREKQKSALFAKKAANVMRLYDPSPYLERIRNELYLPESAIQDNLLRAQLEFYFSDYNLKRDKRLLEAIVNSRKPGYLPLSEVMKLTRIRQVCTSPREVLRALESSRLIDVASPPRADKDKGGRVLPPTSCVEPSASSKKIRSRAAMEALSLVSADSSVRSRGSFGSGGFSETGSMLSSTTPKEGSILSLYIGRPAFRPHSEKEFPFRRTVFIYGAALDTSIEDMELMFKPFGAVQKVQFDYGKHSLDRDIQSQLMKETKVHKLWAKPCSEEGTESNQLMNFETAVRDDSGEYKCGECKKTKHFKDSYYFEEAAGGRYIEKVWCLQCGARVAEDAKKAFEELRNKMWGVWSTQRLEAERQRRIGTPPRISDCSKTALVVFASQRQASKCVFVRSRLATDDSGVFVTHFHHYNKMKQGALDARLSDCDSAEDCEEQLRF